MVCKEDPGTVVDILEQFPRIFLENFHQVEPKREILLRRIQSSGSEKEH